MLYNEMFIAYHSGNITVWEVNNCDCGSSAPRKLILVDEKG
jgi:hypothetical protein